MDLDFIDQPGIEILLGDVWTASDHDISITRDGSCLFQSACDSISHEEEAPGSSSGFFRNMVCDDEGWHLVWIIGKAILRGTNLIGALAHDDGPGRF